MEQHIDPGADRVHLAAVRPAASAPLLYRANMHRAINPDPVQADRKQVFPVEPVDPDERAA
jgi:hypothetical protein